MQQQFDTVIVLSQRTNPDGELSERTEERTCLGIEIFKENFVKNLTMSGGYEGKIIPNIPTHAEAMSNFAMKNGIEIRNIFLEDKSLDTVGQAVFTKKYLAIPQEWKKILVVSSDYHIERVKEIFEFVYGDNYNIVYIAAPTEGNGTDIRAKENASLQSFYDTFRGINPGDDEKIFQTLFSKHPYYKNLQRDEY